MASAPKIPLFWAPPSVPSHWYNINHVERDEEALRRVLSIGVKYEERSAAVYWPPSLTSSMPCGAGVEAVILA